MKISGSPSYASTDRRGARMSRSEGETPIAEDAGLTLPDSGRGACRSRCSNAEMDCGEEDS